MKKTFMKKMLPITIKLGFIGALLTISGTVISNVGAPPVGRTGAPGEGTCAQSGCHVGNPLNSGDATNEIIVSLGSINLSTYQPGQTYTIRVRTVSDGTERFGFQATALQNDGTMAGSFNLVNSNTRLGMGFGKTYVTQTNAGSVAAPTGSKTWMFEWTAPATDVGDITFYASVNASNNNGRSTGDEIYTISKTVTNGPVGIAERPQRIPVNVFPTVVTEEINLTYALPSSGLVEVDLVDLQGQSVQTLLSEEQMAGDQTVRIAAPSGLASGVYFLKISTPRSTQLEKIVLP